MFKNKQKIDPEYEAQFETVKAPKVKKPGLLDKLATKMKMPKWAVCLVFIAAIALIVTAIVLPIKLLQKDEVVDSREWRVPTAEGFAEALKNQAGKPLTIPIGNAPAEDDEDDPPILELVLDGKELQAVQKDTILLIKAKQIGRAHV